MAAEYQYFYEDEVYRFNKKGNIEFGMVLENAELVSSDENSDVEEGGRMKKGHIRVAWHPKGVEEVIAERKVGLADRSLMPGDVVRRMIKGKDTQRGYCRNINVVSGVQVVGTKQVIPVVSSNDLIPLEEFSADIAVCLDSWVGGIKSVHSKVHLQCSDGSRCILNDLDACALEDADDKKDKDSEFQHSDFYPGQTLWGPVHCLEDAEWLHCTKDMKQIRQKPNKNVRVVVDDVKVDSVGVHWQCRAYSKDGAGSEKEQPKFVVQGEDLKRMKLLNVFEPCTLQVGDRNFYTFKDGDTLMLKEQWRKTKRDEIASASIENGPLRPKPSPKRVNDKVPAVVENSNQVSLQPQLHNQNAQSPSSLTEVSAVDHENNNSDQYEDMDTDDTGSQSDTASISSSCSTGSLGKKKKGPALMTRVLKKKKLRRAKKQLPMMVVKPGSKIVVETLCTSSKADVVWQDGSVEQGIPSTALYPIHHLDDQEFFPGDFVIENKDDSSMRVYGVVQSVDHAGRTARVKWFRTYTSSDEPRPTLLEQNEVSVYDLKDHPDFQYRPGTVVIRVANFEGEDAHCTAGQVLDNYPEGRVEVWWVDGHVSMCWPQDLYKVGEYDSDEGELWDDGSSDASWETESEDCFVADVSCPEEGMEDMLKPKLAANIEKARIAMSRLEEIFTQNPSLQTTSVMRQLLEVYKDCRYLDKLMGTSFFHESHFQGLLERVRERGRANAAQRVADQVSRLFQSGRQEPVPEDKTPTSTSMLTPASSSDASENASSGGVVDDSGVYSNKDSSSSASESFASGEFLLSENLVNLEKRISAANSTKIHGSAEIDTSLQEITLSSNNNVCTGTSESKSENVSRKSETKNRDEVKSREYRPVEEVKSSHVCVKLCSLIKAQLVKAHGEVTKRFGGQVTLSDTNLGDSPDNEVEGEEVLEKQKEEVPCVLDSVSSKEEEKEPESKEDENVNRTSVPETTSKLESATESVCSSSVEKKEEEETEAVPVVAEVEPVANGEILGEGFSILETAPNSHKFKLTMFQPTDPKQFCKTVRKELKLLRTSLPMGIWVKGFEDRMDLYSVMIKGPEKTPYEDGLFFFDFQLSADYPKAPPVCHYISYCTDRLNPNLYEDGKVCVSLLGTWSGKGTEVWTLNSNLLQVIISLQGLILVSEPYFNEAGYEKQKGTQQGRENSRMYNEMVVLKLVQSLSKLILQPPEIFKTEIFEHFQEHAYKLISRLETWLEISERYNNSHPMSPTTPTTFRELHGDAITTAVNILLPEFPLIPASKGFCLTLRKTLVTFRDVLASVGIKENS